MKINNYIIEKIAKESYKEILDVLKEILFSNNKIEYDNEVEEDDRKAFERVVDLLRKEIPEDSKDFKNISLDLNEVIYDRKVEKTEYSNSPKNNNDN